jgi:short subunit dehydrogenase-like uncharacterized protein
MSRIVLFGATGFTGRLTAAALVDAGRRPVLAGRDAGRLEAAARGLGGLPTQVAHAGEPASVAALLQPGDVLISTVGPFARHGDAAVRAALHTRAHYVDSSGEAGFVRDLFERTDPAARAAGSTLLPAFGYDWVPGNLAGAMALADAGAAASRVHVGYFTTGPFQPSSGTRATALASGLSAHHRFVDGRLRSERPLARRRVFRFEGRELPALSMGGSEQIGLPRLAPNLREVGVYLGWFGRLGRARAVVELVAGLGRPARSGPDAGRRARSGSLVLATAEDDTGRELATVALRGPDPYDLTARLLTWAAGELLDRGATGPGVLAPVEAFGLQRLSAAAATLGITRA